MVRRKYRGEVWHHRVPDFQLVYCGPETPNKTGKLKSPKGARPSREVKLVSDEYKAEKVESC